MTYDFTTIMERRGMTGNGFPLSPIQPSKGAAMGSYEREQQMIAAAASAVKAP